MDKKALLDTYAFQRGYISLLVDDIPEDRMTHQPAGVPNHPAWQIGHIAVATDGFMPGLGRESALDETWGELFGMRSTPVADASKYPDKQELLRVMDERRGALAAAVKEASNEVLARPNPVPVLAQGLPTMWHMVHFGMLMHEATHLGQLAVWRKAAGMVPALSKVQM
ncbi:MAG: DinB family protein [Phycisphaeraceae bacterium]|nr:DinB family protein [Phycisphaeraceae bacterium]